MKTNMNENIKEILYKQLELLAEASRKNFTEELPQLTFAMVELAKIYKDYDNYLPPCNS